MKNLMEKQYEHSSAQAMSGGIVGMLIGLLIAIVIDVAVVIPVVNSVITNSGVTDPTTLTILNIVPVLVAVIPIILIAAFLR